MRFGDIFRYTGIFGSKKYNVSNTTSNNKYAMFRGLGLAVVSGLFFSAISVIVKKISNISPDQTTLYRFIGISVLSLPDAVKCGKNLAGPRDFRLFLVLQGLFSATNILLSFYAFRLLPLGDASVIVFSDPIFVTVAARIFLKEQCGCFQSLAVMLTVFGILLTTKLPLQLFGSSHVYTESSIYGYVAAVGSVFFNTCRYMFMRKVKTVPTPVIVFISGWVSVFETACLTAILGTFKWHDCKLDKLYIILLGFASYMEHLLLIIAVQCEQAGPVSTMRSATNIALGFFWQSFLFHDAPDAFSISGALLVIFSATFLALRKLVSTLSPESSYFKKLKWMTL